MKKVIVTGGAGFIGSHLAEALVIKGYQVVILDNFSTGRMDNIKNFEKSPNLNIEKIDISDFSTVTKSLKGLHLYFISLHWLISSPQSKNPSSITMQT